jgi:hypothetical protein
MILYINTTQNNLVGIGIKDKNKFIVKKTFVSRRTQAEKLLPSIDKLLKTNKLKLSDLKGIEVANQGGSFTSLRIGVVTANALAYALGIPAAGELGKAKMIGKGKRGFQVVEPEYSGKPEITVKKQATVEKMFKN